MDSERVMKLSDCEEGFKGRVYYFDADADDIYRLYNMGFFPGNEVVVIGKSRGKLILKLGRYIKSIEKKIANKIYLVEDDRISFVE